MEVILMCWKVFCLHFEKKFHKQQILETILLKILEFFIMEMKDIV